MTVISRYALPLLASTFLGLIFLPTIAQGETDSVLAINDRFVLSGDEGDVLFDVLANDMGEVQHIESVSSSPNGASVTNLGKSIAYSPQSDARGFDQFSYVIVGSDGRRSLGIVSVIVSRAATQWRIMPIGDSITEAEGTQNSYRRPLWQALENDGFDTDFVGSRSGNLDGQVPNPDFDTDHEGHWGWRADQILANIGTWAQTYQPDVALIHLGTNDLRDSPDVTQTILEIEQIIDALRVANPNVRVLIAQITPVARAFDGNITLFNTEIPGLALAMSTTESPVFAVDQNTGFDPAVDTYDGVHPNLAGEEKIAGKWYEVLGPAINEAPEISQSIPDVTGRVGDLIAVNLANYFSDPEAQTLAYSSTALPAGLQLDPVTGEVSGSPSSAGSSSVSFTATDIFGATAVTSVNVAIESAPSPQPAPPQNSGGGAVPLGFVLLMVMLRRYSRGGRGSTMRIEIGLR